MLMHVDVTSGKETRRSSKTIAEESSREQDPHRLLELTKELIEALEEETNRQDKKRTEIW